MLGFAALNPTYAGAAWLKGWGEGYGGQEPLRSLFLWERAGVRGMEVGVSLSLTRHPGLHQLAVDEPELARGAVLRAMGAKLELDVPN
ncbi:hypothetical protein NS274_18275 [Pseudomonas oryzihabitans]|nr:hypothetical protein NS274_18275 [Pseudomonas psychrotolerans]KTT08952.1 hypothetical protein NS2R_21065 [Pseudomonas psychrotolerans]KTT50784.1 hypothetical protein SB11R_06505 [Pseudomonas psychrotolerans]